MCPACLAHATLLFGAALAGGATFLNRKSAPAMPHTTPHLPATSPLHRHPVVPPAEWLKARRQLLRKEKEITRKLDELAAARRALPWMRVEKEYRFTGPQGSHTLGELFGKQPQLAVYHFMLGPGWEQGCKSCSFLADHLTPMVIHMAHRHTNLVMVSRAPYPELAAFQQRMGWEIPWFSSYGTDFNFDFHVSATEEAMAAGTVEYNFGPAGDPYEEMPGLSVFFRDDAGTVFHTYSGYARGLDGLVGTFQLLDRTPIGRDEAPGAPMQWLRHHDRYED